MICEDQRSGAFGRRNPRRLRRAMSRASGLQSLGGPVAKAMQKISYSGYRFPPEILQEAIWAG